jgi:hypothetical protein
MVNLWPNKKRVSLNRRLEVVVHNQTHWFSVDEMKHFVRTEARTLTATENKTRN